MNSVHPSFTGREETKMQFQSYCFLAQPRRNDGCLMLLISYLYTLSYLYLQLPRKSQIHLVTKP